MPTTRFADVPVIATVQIPLNPLNTEYSLALPGQCFGLQIRVGGSAWNETYTNFFYVKLAFEPNVVTTTDGPFFTIYSRPVDGQFARDALSRYQNYRKPFWLPRNKFVRDLTIYAAAERTSTSGNVVYLQAMYWTTPTP